MNGFAIVSCLLLATPGSFPTSGLPDQFRLGVENRDNRVEAMKHFRDVAKRSDVAWRNTTRAIELALMRSRSHFLSDNLPQALLAIHDGLAISPSDYRLKRELAALRETIRYPETNDPQLRVRPDPLTQFRHLVSPWNLYYLGCAFGVVTAIGIVQMFTTRPRWTRIIVVIGVLGFLMCAALAWHVTTTVAEPCMILTRDTILRTGNGDSYAARLSEPMPRGCELRELARRGSWIQVELPGGAAGWIPEWNTLGNE